MLPESVVEPLQKHLARVRQIHEKDLAEGYGAVELPHAPALKHPRAAYEWILAQARSGGIICTRTISFAR